MTRTMELHDTDLRKLHERDVLLWMQILMSQT